MLICRSRPGMEELTSAPIKCCNSRSAKAGRAGFSLAMAALRLASNSGVTPDVGHGILQHTVPYLQLLIGGPPAYSDDFVECWLRTVMKTL